MARDAGKVIGREARAAARVARGGRLMGARDSDAFDARAQRGFRDRGERGPGALRPLTVAALIFCVVTFCALAAMVVLGDGAPLGLDRAAWRLAEPLRFPQAVRVLRAISTAGTGGLLAGCAVGCWLGSRIRGSAVYQRFSLALLANVVLVELVNRAIKAVIARPRPTWALLSVGDFSFPSGHTMNVVAFWGLAIWAVWLVGSRRLPRRGAGARPVRAPRPAALPAYGADAPSRRPRAYASRAELAREVGASSAAGRFALTAVGAACIVLVPLSRVCLGVHYASDVIAGLCLGAVWVVAYVHLVGPWIVRGRRTG